MTRLTATAPNGTFFTRVRATNPCGVSGPSNEASFVVPSVNLSGNWVGTVSPLPCPTDHGCSPLTLVLLHTGNRITGSFSIFPGVSLDGTLVQEAQGTMVFQATLTLVESGGGCSPALQRGLLTVDTAEMRMTGTLSGINNDCLPETSVFDLRRQS